MYRKEKYKPTSLNLEFNSSVSLLHLELFVYMFFLHNFVLCAIKGEMLMTFLQSELEGAKNCFVFWDMCFPHPGMGVKGKCLENNQGSFLLHMVSTRFVDWVGEGHRAPAVATRYNHYIHTYTGNDSQVWAWKTMMLTPWILCCLLISEILKCIIEPIKYYLQWWIIFDYILSEIN